MSDGKGAGKGQAADLEDLARRFQDLWREQMAATAADPEFMEMMGKWMGAFSAGMQPPGSAGTAMSSGFPGQPGMPPMDPAAWMAALQAAMTGAKGVAGERDSAKAGPAPAAAASGAGDVAGDELERRIADLEQRVERLEAGSGGKGRGPARGTRKRKS